MRQDTHPIYLERWANAYKLATTIPNDNRFKMDIWGQPEESSECGTAGCLAGHACLNRWFADEGLRYGTTPIGPEKFILVINVDEFFGYSDFSRTPFNPLSSLYAHLITPPSSLTPAQVAEAVVDHMHRYWTHDEVKQAIENAVAVYDAEYIHALNLWDYDEDQGSRDVRE